MSPRLDRRAAVAIGLMALLAILPLVATWLDQGFYVGQLRRVLIFAIAAVSLDIILGYGGMVSLGHAAFVGAGAYVVALLHWHADRGIEVLGILPGTMQSLATIPAAMLVAALLALAIGAISLRTSGLYFIMITLAFAQMIYYVAIGLKTYGGEDGLSLPGRSAIGLGIDLTHDITFYYLVLAIFAAAMFALNRVVDSRFGRVLVGIRENETRMEAIGFSTYQARLIAFVIAGALAGLAGVLFANHNSFVSPTALHWTQSATLVIMVILGGIGYRYGGPIGAAVLLLLEEVLSQYTEYWHLALGVLLLIVVFAAPRGLTGLVSRRVS
jgi:branched-chain amino acid transport system permease protein